MNEGIYEISSFSLACNMFCLKIELKIEKIYILNIQKNTWIYLTHLWVGVGVDQ